MQELKDAAPGIRRMLTEEPTEPLFGSVDIWCPVLPNHNAEACSARQKLGESIWWYVCTGPQAPWPGLFIDHGATDLRVWLWMTWKWNVEAVLVWASNYWTSYCAYTDKPQDPWQDPMSYVSGYGLPPGFIGYWGNGDGRFMYPPRPSGDDPQAPIISGPVNSIRWEMLREGIEDFEYFTRLRELVAAKGDCPEARLLEVPAEIVGGQTEFATDPQLLYVHRAAMARAIERLEGGR
jgi:hypothetical protein